MTPLKKLPTMRRLLAPGPVPLVRRPPSPLPDTVQRAGVVEAVEVRDPRARGERVAEVDRARQVAGGEIWLVPFWIVAATWPA